MDSTILAALLSTGITGIFALIGKAIEQNKPQPPAGPQNYYPPTGYQGQYLPTNPPSPYVPPGYPPPYPAPTQQHPYPSQPFYGPSVATMMPPPPALPPSVNLGRVLQQIGVIQLIANVAGFILGLMLSTSVQSGAIDGNTFLLIVLLFGTIVLSAALAWVGARVASAVRWKHLLYVGTGVAITTLLLNSLVLGTSINLLSLIVAIIQTGIAVGLGGVIANATSKVA